MDVVCLMGGSVGLLLLGTILVDYVL